MAMNGLPPLNELKRRTFFKSLAGQVLSLAKEIHGIPQYHLSNLWQMPDPQLSFIRPVLQSDVEIMTEEKSVNGRFRSKENTFLIFDREDKATFVFNQFNGQKTIGQISDELATEYAMEKEIAFAFCKDFFLKLIHLKVCIPANQIE
jgi:hypothetical protein